MAFFEFANNTGGVRWSICNCFIPFLVVGFKASIMGTVEWFTLRKLISWGPLLKFFSDPFEGDAENCASHWRSLCLVIWLKVGSIITTLGYLTSLLFLMICYVYAVAAMLSFPAWNTCSLSCYDLVEVMLMRNFLYCSSRFLAFMYFGLLMSLLWTITS